MRVVLRRQNPPEGVGATAGAIGASALVTAAEAPELIPIAAPLGAAAGGYAEKGVRGLIKRDSDPPLAKCEDLTNLRYLWDEEMVRLQAAVGREQYEDAERHGSELIDLDARILRAVNCYEANKRASVHAVMTA